MDVEVVHCTKSVVKAPLMKYDSTIEMIQPFNYLTWFIKNIPELKKGALNSKDKIRKPEYFIHTLLNIYIMHQITANYGL